VTKVMLGAQSQTAHKRKEGDTVFKRGKEDSDPKSTTCGGT